MAELRGNTAKCARVAMMSQFGEDIDLRDHWLPWHPELLNGGTFVEIGGLEGVALSNTYWLEMCLGWRGLLIEGHPVNWAKCSVNRVNCVHSAVCDKEHGTVKFTHKNGPTAGQPKLFPASFMERFHRKAHQQGVISVNCTRFDNILRANGIGRIDVLLLDVENAELIVLRTMDWVANPIRLIIIERARSDDRSGPKRDKLLKRHCMVKNKKLSGQWSKNDWWENPVFPLPACSNHTSTKPSTR